MSEHTAENDAASCPACGHPEHPDAACEVNIGYDRLNDVTGCACEWDPAFCGRCGWLDCECPESVTPPASTGDGA